jgi:hypothetical protein
MSIRQNGKIIAGATQYHPDLFDWKWADHELDDMSWLRADTFSWQDGTVYEEAYKHLIEDYEENVLAWMWTGGVYTAHRYPSVGDKAYSDNTLTTELGTITATSDSTITVNSQVYSFNGSYTNTPSSETIAGITIQYYLSSDGHKICANGPGMSAAEAIYAATGVAWYYILDVANQRFKLPRAKHNKYAASLNVFGNGNPLVMTDGTDTLYLMRNYMGVNEYRNTVQITTDGLVIGESKSISQAHIQKGIGVSTDSSKSGMQVAQTQDTDQYKYLYFYIGSFTQTAVENTAGLNAELFNGKADLDFGNTSMIDYVVEKQDPTSSNNYTWYRKYRSGWVEQGGRIPGNVGGTYNVSMPVEMADTNYNFIGTGYKDNNDNGFVAACIDTSNMSTTGFRVYTRYVINGSTGSPSQGGQWQVSGMAA